MAQESREQLPKVVAASVPFYPPPARVAGIQGIVVMRISTDGRQISEVHVEKGQPMLARAAEENVRTWELREHAPTVFEAIFKYKLLSEWECYTDSGVVLLRLPLKVEITAKQLRTCDPAADQ